jgi:hypothetical protein
MANIERRVRDGKVRCYARHYDPSGNRHTKVFDTKAEADRFLTSVEMSKITGSYVDPNRSQGDSWRPGCSAARGQARPSAEDQGSVRRNHSRACRATLGQCPVIRCHTRRSPALLARLDLAPATVRKVHRVLSMIMVYAMKDGRLAVKSCCRCQPAARARA